MARDLIKSNGKPTQEEIAARAYAIFEERGRPEGRDLEHWLDAERQLQGEAQLSKARLAGASANSAPSVSTNATLKSARPSARQPFGRRA